MLIGGLLSDLSLVAFVLKSQFVFALDLQLYFFFFSKAFPNGEYVNLACSIICCWSDGNISSPVRYSYLWILPDDKADMLAASLLMSYCSFLSILLFVKNNLYYLYSVWMIWNIWPLWIMFNFIFIYIIIKIDHLYLYLQSFAFIVVVTLFHYNFLKNKSFTFIISP